MRNNSVIRKIYLYLFTTVGLAMLLIGTAQIVNLGLRTWVFTEADQRYEYEVDPYFVDDRIAIKDGATSTVQKIDYNKSERHRDLSTALSFILVGLPLYLYHWVNIKKDKKNEE